MNNDAGLDIFTVPEHVAASLGEQYGYYEEYVRGQGYFITRDHLGAAVVGPRRHRGLGWLPRLRERGRRRKAQRALEAPSGAEGQKMGRSWRQRLSDRDWHSAVQHTALDFTMWVCGLSLSVAFVKAAWWVLCL